MIAKIDANCKTGIPFLDNKFLEYYKNKNQKLKNNRETNLDQSLF